MLPYLLTSFPVISAFRVCIGDIFHLKFLISTSEREQKVLVFRVIEVIEDLHS